MGETIYSYTIYTYNVVSCVFVNCLCCQVIALWVPISGSAYWYWGGWYYQHHGSGSLYEAVHWDAWQVLWCFLSRGHNKKCWFSKICFFLSGKSIGWWNIIPCGQMFFNCFPSTSIGLKPIRFLDGFLDWFVRVCFVWYVFKIGAAYFRLGIIFWHQIPPAVKRFVIAVFDGSQEVWCLESGSYALHLQYLYPGCTWLLRTWQGKRFARICWLSITASTICLVELYTHVHQFIPGTVYTSLWCFSQFVSSQIRNAVFFWSQKSYQSFWILGQEPWVFDRTRYMDEKEIMRALQVRR